MTKRFVLSLSILVLASSAGAQPMALVTGALEELIVQAEDLPLTFSMAGSNAEGPSEHAAIYFRPEILAAPEMPRGAVLGVMAHLEVGADAASATERFAENRTAEAIRSTLDESESAEQVLDVRELPAGVAGTDEAIAFRVEYELQGVHLVEYRYRLRVANAIVNLMVSGRTSDKGAEPPGLAQQASRIAERQASRLASNRS